MKKEEINNYDSEVKEKWGSTNQYKEFINKNKNKKELEIIKNELLDLFNELGNLKQESIESEIVQKKIKKLQEFITKNYYNCTDEILKNLGQMYVNDERFKKNIDKAGGEGTAEFVNQAIIVYCNHK